MEEQFLIKSEKFNLKKIFIVMSILGIILSILFFLMLVESSTGETYEYVHETYLEHQENDFDCYGEGKCGWCERFEETPSKFMFYAKQSSCYHFLSLIPIPASILIGALIYLALSSYELTVTDKRIFGMVAWGKRVDLPVDSVSATAINPKLKGISISTSSGKISFLVIKNANDLYNVINDLLIARQPGKSNVAAESATSKSDEAEQIKKYKDLLDSGIITQEEFDAKKKQLLGL